MDDIKHELYQSSIDIPGDGLELGTCGTKGHYVIDLWEAFRAQWCMNDEILLRLELYGCSEDFSGA